LNTISPHSQIPANILLVKNTTVHGLFWGSYLQNEPQVRAVAIG